MQRDPRWENVVAYIGPVQTWSEEELAMGVKPSDWYEVEIEVHYERVLFWFSQRIAVEDLGDIGDFDWVEWALEPGVLRIDGFMHDMMCATEFENLRRAGPKYSHAQMSRMDHLEEHLDRNEMYCICL